MKLKPFHLHYDPSEERAPVTVPVSCGKDGLFTAEIPEPFYAWRSSRKYADTFPEVLAVTSRYRAGTHQYCVNCATLDMLKSILTKLWADHVAGVRTYRLVLLVLASDSMVFAVHHDSGALSFSGAEVPSADWHSGKVGWAPTHDKHGSEKDWRFGIAAEAFVEEKIERDGKATTKYHRLQAADHPNAIPGMKTTIAGAGEAAWRLKNRVYDPRVLWRSYDGQPMPGVKVLPYTEELAQRLVDMILALCALQLRFHHLFQSDNLADRLLAFNPAAHAAPLALPQVP